MIDLLFRIAWATLFMSSVTMLMYYIFPHHLLMWWGKWWHLHRALKLVAVQLAGVSVLCFLTIAVKAWWY